MQIAEIFAFFRISGCDGGDVRF